MMAARPVGRGHAVLLRVGIPSVLVGVGVLGRLVPGHTARKLLLMPTYAPGGGAGIAMALSL